MQDLGPVICEDILRFARWRCEYTETKFIAIYRLLFKFYGREEKVIPSIDLTKKTIEILNEHDREYSILGNIVLPKLFRLAIFSHKVEIAKFCLSLGLCDEHLVVGHCITFNKAEYVPVLKESGVDLNYPPYGPYGDSQTALMRAVKFGDRHFVQALLESGVDVYQQDSEEKTVFDYLDKEKNKDIAKMLAKYEYQE